MGFWSVKNAHIWEFVLVGVIGSVVAVWKFAPPETDIFGFPMQSVVAAGYVATAFIVALVAGTIFVPAWVGRGLPCIFLVGQSFPTLSVFQRFLFISWSETEPLGKQLDITPLMRKDKFGEPLPQWFGERWWWLYRLKLEFKRDIPRFGEVEYVALMLPAPLKTDLDFQEMEEVELWGEFFKHPSAALLNVIMIPVAIKYQGVEIPFFLGAFADKQARNITLDWIPTMREAARYMTRFDQIIKEHEEDIYPFKELELQGSEILTPESKNKLEEVLGRKKKEPEGLTPKVN